jgi:hypothetical protein
MCFIAIDAVELVERKESQRVATNRPPHALEVHPVGYQLALARRVNAVQAGADDRRARDAHVHLPRAGVAEKAHDLARSGAAHERVVDDDDALARDDLAHGRELQLDGEVADCLRRPDETAAAVVPPNEALLELEP